MFIEKKKIWGGPSTPSINLKKNVYGVLKLPKMFALIKQGFKCLLQK